jgi:acetate kinase
MTDAILVLNAGSSSIKFSIFVARGDQVALDDRGQVILCLLDECGMDPRGIEKPIYNQSGLLGVSGISSDMRTLLESEHPRAKLAIDLHLYRIRRELGSLAAALGGLDAIVFTAGIGENAALIRSRFCLDAAWLGVEVDAGANAAAGPRISTERSSEAAWVIPTK